VGFGKAVAVFLVLAVFATACGPERSRRAARATKTPVAPTSRAAVDPPVEEALVTIADDPVRARRLAAHVELVVAEMSAEDDLGLKLERASRGLGDEADEAPASPEPTLATASELVSMLASTPGSRSVLAPLADKLSGKTAGRMAHVTAVLSASVGADVAVQATLREMDEEQELAENDLLPLREERRAPSSGGAVAPSPAKPTPAVAAPAALATSAAPASSPQVAPGTIGAASVAPLETAGKASEVKAPDAAQASKPRSDAGIRLVLVPPMPVATLAPVPRSVPAPAKTTPEPSLPASGPAAESPAAGIAAAAADAAAVVAASASPLAGSGASSLIAAVIKEQAGPGPDAATTLPRTTATPTVAPGPGPEDDELGQIAARVKWERDELELIFQDTVDVARADDPEATSAENSAYALCMTAALAKQGNFAQLREDRDRAFDELERDGTRGHCTAVALADGSDHADARQWDGLWTKRQRSWMTTRCARDAARIYGTTVESERATCECLHAVLAKRISLDKLLRLDDQGFARMIEADAQLSACLGQ
jgi:hypothetical protein